MKSRNKERKKYFFSLADGGNTLPRKFWLKGEGETGKHI